MKTNAIRLTTENSKKNSLFAETIPSVLLLFGLLFALRDAMPYTLCLYASLAVGTVILAVLQLTQRSPKIAGYVRIGIYVLTLAACLAGISFVVRGFLMTANRTIALLNNRFDFDWSTFSVTDNRLSGIWFWLLLTVLFTALSLLLSHRHLLIGYTLCVAAALFFGYILGYSTMWIATLLLIAGMLLSFAFALAPLRIVRTGTLLAVLSIAVVFGILLLSTSGFQGSARIAQWKKNVVTQLEEFRYGSDTLPQGDLSKARQLGDGTNDTLTLHTDQLTEMHLKGFVGGTYTGSVWEPLDKTWYHSDYEGMLKWLTEQGFSPTAQFADYFELDSAQTIKQYTSVQVENTNAYRKYAYVPYTLSAIEGNNLTANKDWQIESNAFFGSSDYTFTQTVNMLSAESSIAKGWDSVEDGQEGSSYAAAETVYHSFVENSYLSNDVDSDVIQSVFFDGTEVDLTDFYQVTARIRAVLREDITYTEKPQTYTGREDFAKWFLQDVKSGNAMYYATAAVLAYRAAGYPARYVEGYYLTAEDAAQMAESGDTAFTLTDANAHTWAEVYASGIGWVPVEVVPGLYTENYSNEIVAGKPIYSVSGKISEDGLEADLTQGNGGNVDSAPEPETASVPHFAAVILLLVLYLLFFLFVLLELQRAVRLLVRRRHGKAMPRAERISAYSARITKMLQVEHITGDYSHPLELTEQVLERFPGLQQSEYLRVIALLQKVVFGGAKLRPYEWHTLNCFEQRLRTLIYYGKPWYRRLLLRYRYAF